MAKFAVSEGDAKVKQGGGLYRPKGQDHQKKFDGEHVQTLCNEHNYCIAEDSGMFKNRRSRAVAKDV